MTTLYSTAIPHSSFRRRQWRRVAILQLVLLALYQTSTHSFGLHSRAQRVHPPRMHQSSSPVVTFSLFASPDNDEKDPSSNRTMNSDKNTNQEDTQQDASSSSFLSSAVSRFTSPRLDDPFLPLSDALVAQIIAPSLQIAWLSLNHAPSPTWLQPIFGKSQLIGNGAGSLLAPTLIHGAALATCWLVGALAARAYERDAIAVHPQTGSYGIVLARVVQAGCFATGVLILGTQWDLYSHFGYVQWGDSPETDFRLQVALVEAVNDVFFEAITLVSWRLYLAYQSRKRMF